MNIFSQCLFLLFYVLSSYAISQQRAENIAFRVQRSATNTELAQINADPAVQNSDFPNYRQAKPKTIAIGRFAELTSHYLSRVTGPSFESAEYLEKSTCITECILSRAPPHQS